MAAYIPRVYIPVAAPRWLSGAYVQIYVNSPDNLMRPRGSFRGGRGPITSSRVFFTQILLYYWVQHVRRHLVSTAFPSGSAVSPQTPDQRFQTQFGLTQEEHAKKTCF